MYLRGKFPHKHNSEIKDMVLQKSNGYILEEEALDIIKYMYNEEDAKLLGKKIKSFYTPQTKQVVYSSQKKLSREEQ